MTTVREMLWDWEGQIRAASIPDPRLEAEILAMEALNLDRAHLLAELPCEVGGGPREYGELLLKKRLSHEPSAYLVGRKEFWGLDLLVSPNVLIPRPETETLVEESIRLIKGWGLPNRAVNLVDVGTGSGAIAIALATEFPHIRVQAIDISAEALKIADINCKAHGVSDRVNLCQGDLLDPLDRPCDLIVANLPYIKTSDISELPPEISSYEPRTALDGGEFGTNLITKLIRSSGSYLKPHGFLVLEIDPYQAECLIAAAKAVFPQSATSLVPDLSGRNRVLRVGPDFPMRF